MGNAAAGADGAPGGGSRAPAGGGEGRGRAPAGRGSDGDAAAVGGRGSQVEAPAQAHRKGDNTDVKPLLSRPTTGEFNSPQLFTRNFDAGQRHAIQDLRV
eukprot:6934511-Pyramimonas_sp.AAC.1